MQQILFSVRFWDKINRISSYGRQEEYRSNIWPCIHAALSIARKNRDLRLETSIKISPGCLMVMLMMVMRWVTVILVLSV